MLRAGSTRFCLIDKRRLVRAFVLCALAFSSGVPKTTAANATEIGPLSTLPYWLNTALHKPKQVGQRGNREIQEQRKAGGWRRRGFENLTSRCSGDMNELGGSGDTKLFKPIFSDFGDLNISDELFTCCDDSHWTDPFDRIVTHVSDMPKATIIDAKYPLIPPVSEEHKAIYGVVTFSAAR
jgi:hypothetical protein